MADKPHFITTIFTKLIFTIIIGMIFLSWDVDNLNDYHHIHNSSPYPQITQDTIIPDESLDTLPKDNTSLNDLMALITPYRGEDKYDALTPEIEDEHIQIICSTLSNICRQIFILYPTPRSQWLRLSLGKIIIIQSQRKDLSNIRDGYLYTLTIKDDSNGSRGYANHNHIVINIAQTASVEEFIKVLSHEIAHIIDFGIIKGSDHTLSTDYTEFNRTVFAIDDPSLDYYRISRHNEQTRRISSQQQDFCTRYAMTNPFEDLAECITLYLHHHDYFLIIRNQSPVLQAKYNRIAQYLNPPTIIRSSKKYLTTPGHRYRDSTKIGL